MDNKKIDLAKELGLSGDYKNFTLDGKAYVLRKPTAMESIEIEDKNIELEGSIDMYGYIQDILKFITPKLKIEDVIEKKDNIIVIGDKTLHFEKVGIEQGFKTILATSKIDTNSNGERVMKLNRHGAIKKIIEFAHAEDESITLNSFKTKDELNQLLEKFQELVDASKAMEVYDTFQSI